MERITLILGISLTVYAVLAGLAWLKRLIGERLTARKRGMMLNLLRRSGPPIAGGQILLFAGTVFDLPGSMPVAAVLIAGGAAYGFHRGLAEVRQGDWRVIVFRLALTAGLSLALLWQAGVI